MKSIILNRSMVLILSLCVALLFSGTAYANENVNNQVTKINVQESINYNQTDTAVVPPNDFVRMRFTLEKTDSTMRFVVNAYSEFGTSGTLNLYLYGPDSNLADSWSIGINEAGYWNFSKPATGTWMLVIIPSDVTEYVDVFAGWVNPK